MTDDLSIPFCETCRHRHHQGTKCLVCGHVGRCTIFTKMMQKSQRAAALRYVFLGVEGIHDRSSGLYDLVKELRVRVYCFEGSNRTMEMEFGNVEEEHMSTHLLGFLGDAPVCVARFHTVPVHSPNNTYTAIIDRLGVVPSHRGQGIEKATQDHILKIGKASTLKVV